MLSNHECKWCSAKYPSEKKLAKHNVTIQDIVYTFYFYKQLHFKQLGPILGKKLSNFFKGLLGLSKKTLNFDYSKE